MDGGLTNAAGVMGEVTLNTGTVIVMDNTIQDPAGLTGTLTVMGDDGKDIDITIGFAGDARRDRKGLGEAAADAGCQEQCGGTHAAA